PRQPQSHPGQQVDCYKALSSLRLPDNQPNAGLWQYILYTPLQRGQVSQLMPGKQLESLRWPLCCEQHRLQGFSAFSLRVVVDVAVLGPAVRQTRYSGV